MKKRERKYLCIVSCVFIVYFSECSCDRRGTEVTQCPLGSPCYCDPRTGQCPCRTGAMGVLCDECEDGYWNLDGALGCQPCSCDPVNSFNNICDKARPPLTTDTVLFSHSKHRLRLLLTVLHVNSFILQNTSFHVQSMS